MLTEDYQRTSVPACLGVFAETGPVLRGNAGAVLPDLTSSNDSVVRRELEKYMVTGLFRYVHDCLVCANH